MIIIKRIGQFIAVVFILTLLFFTFGTSRYQSMKTKGCSLVVFENKLKKASAENSEIDISKLTNFQWDECYVFTPYYPSKDIYKKVGTEWTTAKTYLGFLVSHNAENDTISDEDFLIVFKKGTKVVLANKYSINQLPVIFKLDNFKFTRKNAKFLVTSSKQYDKGKIKELILKQT